MKVSLLLLMFVGVFICYTNYTNGQNLEVCWPHAENTLCSKIDKQCNSSEDCSNSDEICCRYECGTTCLAKQKVVREPQTLEKCWQFNSSVVNCLRYDVMCSSNSDCGSSQICCAHECGKMCRDSVLIDNHNQRIKRGDDPKTCPDKVTGIVCTMTNFQCRANTDCGDGNICCGVLCGTKCY